MWCFSRNLSRMTNAFNLLGGWLLQLYFIPFSFSSTHDCNRFHSWMILLTIAERGHTNAPCLDWYCDNVSSHPVNEQTGSLPVVWPAANPKIHPETKHSYRDQRRITTVSLSSHIVLLYIILYFFCQDKRNISVFWKYPKHKLDDRIENSFPFEGEPDIMSSDEL